MSEPTVFLSTFLFGPAAGAITAAVDAFVMSLRLIPRLRTPHRVLFNVGTVAIAVYIAGQLYFRLAGLDMRRPVYGAIETFVWPLYVFAGGVFAINSWLVAIALGFERNSSHFRSGAASSFGSRPHILRAPQSQPSSSPSRTRSTGRSSASCFRLSPSHLSQFGQRLADLMTPISISAKSISCICQRSKRSRWPSTPKTR